MSRNYSPTARDVEREYKVLKENMLPSLAPLVRTEFGDWYVGKLCIGSTAREAKAVLWGMSLASRWAGLAGAA